MTLSINPGSGDHPARHRGKRLPAIGIACSTEGIRRSGKAVQRRHPRRAPPQRAQGGSDAIMPPRRVRGAAARTPVRSVPTPSWTHPRGRAEDTIRHLVEVIESGEPIDVPAMRGRVLAQGWVI
jgi:hypothetical protein